MKRFIIMGFLLCCVAGEMLAQGGTLGLIVSRQESELRTLLNKPPTVFADYQEITSLCKKLAENYKRLAYAAESESSKGSNLRKALKYYSDEARYANTAAEKFGNKYMLQVSAKACKNAAFVYRALGKPKVINLLNSTFVDSCKLLPKEEEMDDETTVEEEGKPTDSGPDRRITFKTNDDVFSVKIPYPLEAVTQFGTKASIFTSGELAKLMEQSGVSGFTKSGFNSYNIKGYQISFGFEARARTKLNEQIYGSRPEFSKTKNDRTHSIGNEPYPLKPYKAQLTYDWEWEIDGPIQAKDDLMATISIAFKTKGYFCNFSVTVRNMDDIPIEKKVMEMVRSFRVESVGTPAEKCEDGEFKLLKQGIPVTWTIYDRSRPSAIVQQPVLARDYQVAEAASNYTGAIVAVIKTFKDVKQLTNIPRTAIIDGEMKKAIASLGGWYFEGYHKVEFIPVEIEEYSDMTIDGSLTNAVSFYLEALRDVSKGVSGLGKRMNKMSLRLYWEIPIIKIKGECIPRMICDNGNWKPDLDYMEFKEISRTKGTLRSPNKDFMTVKQVEEDLQRYYYARMDALEADEANYQKTSERCKISKQGLWKIDFPVNFDTCPAIENTIQQKQYELLTLTQIQEVKKTKLKQWLSTLKPAELARLNVRLATLEANKQTMRKEIGRLETLRDNFMNSGQPEKAREIADQITFLGEDITLLDSFKVKTTTELRKVTSGARETEMSKELSKIAAQIIKLEKEKELLKTKLEACIKEQEKIR